MWGQEAIGQNATGEELGKWQAKEEVRGESTTPTDRKGKWEMHTRMDQD